MTEGERISVVLTATHTEVKCVTIGIADGCAPRSKFVELDGEHRLRIAVVCLGLVVLYPFQALTFGVIIVFHCAAVGIGPKVTIVRNKRVARVVDTVVDEVRYHLLRQLGAIGKINFCKRVVRGADQILQFCAVAVHTGVEQPGTCQHTFCSVLVHMSVVAALCGQQLCGLVKVLKDLSPEDLHVTLLHHFTCCRCHQRHVAIHGGKLVVVESTKEESLTQISVAHIIRQRSDLRQSLYQDVGTRNALIAVLVELLGHVLVIIAEQVLCLHELIVGTTATEVIVTGQHGNIEE